MVVVVGVDGSAESARALAWGTSEAALRGVTLDIRYVMHLPVASPPFTDPVTYAEPMSTLRGYADAVLAAARGAAFAREPGVSLTTSIDYGQPAEALISAGASADLVVLGARGLGAFGAIFFGSTSARVAARCSAPVVVVPRQHDAERHDERTRSQSSQSSQGDHDPSWTEVMAGTHHGQGRVVVGVDGSAHSDVAVRFAVDEARRRNAGVLALAVYEVPLIDRWKENSIFYTDIENAARAAAEERLTETVARLRLPQDSGVDVEERVVQGRAAKVLVEAGKDASMTVVGSRGRGEVRGALLGSVSQAILHHARHPVVVVHSPRASRLLDAED
ncbi:universal stress protein [Sanguibacter suarezii]|uniref:universal stress protein n=1 Tax=Sanguibacter suarezii TaxID=60921 RepID=UPI000A904476|nr:universal stress protein [Sanguibacter suarezii]